MSVRHPITDSVWLFVLKNLLNLFHYCWSMIKGYHWLNISVLIKAIFSVLFIQYLPLQSLVFIITILKICFAEHLIKPKFQYICAAINKLLLLLYTCICSIFSTCLFSLSYLQTDDATLVYYRPSDKEYKYLDMEADMEELIRENSLTFDK